MKKITRIVLITITISLFTIHIFAQSCLPEGITFSTQTQIDNFKINHPNCTEIEGGVVIEGDNITNLDSLHVIISIGGYL